jgi:hypothetical protein
VLSLTSPLKVCEDLQGQFDDLLELFSISLKLTSDSIPGRNGLPHEFPAILSSDQNFLFLGDSVDRGHHSFNTFFSLICLKLKSPDPFFLLRGNHESRQISRTYGLYQECLIHYGHGQIWTFCNSVFDHFPIAAVINGSLFAVQGGLSPDLPSVYLISELE